jgi:hypothetical protein
MINQNIGSKNLEHKIATALKRSEAELFSDPGKGGLTEMASCLEIQMNDNEGVVTSALSRSFDMGVVALKDPLECSMKPVRNPHDHNRLILQIDEKKRVVEHVDKGWVTRVEFKCDGTTSVIHYKKR